MRCKPACWSQLKPQLCVVVAGLLSRPALGKRTRKTSVLSTLHSVGSSTQSVRMICCARTTSLMRKIEQHQYVLGTCHQLSSQLSSCYKRRFIVLHLANTETEDKLRSVNPRPLVRGCSAHSIFGVHAAKKFFQCNLRGLGQEERC